MLATFLRGSVLGFSIAAPFGPVGLLCVQRTLRNGALAGLATGMGAAVADALYGLIACHGVPAALPAAGGKLAALKVAGAAILFEMGRRAWAGPAREAARERAGGAFASTFLLALTSPMTIASFAAAYLALGAAGGSPAVFVGGVFLGSCAWWAILTASVRAMRGRLLAHTAAIGRGAGVALMAMGASAAVAALGQ